MARRVKITDDQIRDCFAQGLRDAEIAARYGCSPMTVFAKRRALRLLRPTGAPLGTKRRQDPAIKARKEAVKLTGRPAKMPAFDNPAIVQGRTIYPSTVFEPRAAINLLVSGENHWKIGDRITKGPWKGFPVYTLTLEERATCPESCRHYRSCFGNSMPFARRIEHGPELEGRLRVDLALLQHRHPDGFAVRLHVLGDFYSVEYVRLWGQFIVDFPALRVFGFTARWERDDPIGQALVRLVLAGWPRFAIRFSNAPVEECSTVSIEYPGQAPADAIVCPQQLGKTKSCGTCGLCWATRRRIAFIQH
jgi:hypothetical protein